MVAYLSAEWLARADAVLRTHVDRSGLPMPGPTIGYRVRRGDDVVRYHVELTDDPGVAPGDAVDETVGFELDYAVAVALARGEASAQASFMAGDLVIRGDVLALIPAAEALEAFDDASADLRAETEY